MVYSVQLLWTNNAQTTLAGSISNTATSANLASGTGILFAAPGASQGFTGSFTDVATGLLHEIVLVTGRTGDTITMIRGQEGTTPLNWSANDIFANLWTSGAAASLVQSYQLQNQSGNFAIDTGGVNAYIVGLLPAVGAAPPPGFPLRVKIANTNTGASTINAGWGVIPVVRRDGTALIGGELVANHIADMMWDGTNVQLLNVSVASNAAATAGTDNGSAISPAQLASTSFAPSGSITMTGAISAPTGWLLCCGQSVSRVTYANLFAAITKSNTVSISIATPAVVNLPSHGLSQGDVVSFETTGALPTGLSTATNYYALPVDSNNFNVGTLQSNLNNALTGASWAATSGGQITATTTTAHGLVPGSLAVLSGNSPSGYNGAFVCAAGTSGSTLVLTATSNPGSITTLGSLARAISAVSTSGSQSGVQTGRQNPFGCGDGTSTFTLPDARDCVLAGWSGMGGAARGLLGNNSSVGGFITAAMGNFAGEKAHVQTIPELTPHSHVVTNQAGAGNGAASGGGATSNTNPAPTGTTGGGNAANTTQPTLLVNVIIKT